MSLLRLALVCCLAGCASTALPESAPPLADMEEPLDLRGEPDDEAVRRQLPAGSFSGIEVDDARDTLAAKLDAPSQLRVARVVENSPGAFAGVQVDDVLLEAQVGDGAPQAMRRPSEWRQLELTAAPGTRVVLFVDRAGREARTELVLVARHRPADRSAGERVREELRVGVVLRTATEVEARGAGLGPGGGAVIVGLSRASPWRSAGLRFGDVLTALDGRPVTHPQEVLSALRDPARQQVRVAFRREGMPREVTATLTQRDRDVTDVNLPLLFSYSADRGRSEWSFLLGICHYRGTAAAWRFRFLWVIGFGAGDTDRLIEVGS